MFSKLFKKKEKVARKLEHPRDLQKGDMVVMDDSFLLPQELRGQSFIVEAINGYQYQYGSEASFRLRGDAEQPIFFSIEQDDGQEKACFSMMIERNDVESLFDLDVFADIFDSEDLTSLPTLQQPDEFEGWIAESYQQSAAPVVGYFYERDIRSKKPSSYEEDDAEPVELYNLMSSDGKKAVDVEVWEDGETDVMLTLYRPLTDIKDLFPKESN